MRNVNAKVMGTKLVLTIDLADGQETENGNVSLASASWEVLEGLIGPNGGTLKLKLNAIEMGNGRRNPRNARGNAQAAPSVSNDPAFIALQQSQLETQQLLRAFLAANTPGVQVAPAAVRKATVATPAQANGPLAVNRVSAK